MIKNLPLLALIFFLLFTVNAISVSAQDNECATLFATACSECHEIEKGCDLLGQSKKEWHELFEYMESMGAEISDEIEEKLLACLVIPGDAIKALCKK
ncbi:MAG: hypothetical protein KKB30_00810 [Proteobacteria bacterium]|nr:hypothetical protein [Pseudomonadota bacterium]MBU1715352.1 hypothetical protein [Pseudomonadota bacterium]